MALVARSGSRGVFAIKELLLVLKRDPSSLINLLSYLFSPARAKAFWKPVKEVL